MALANDLAGPGPGPGVNEPATRLQLFTDRVFDFAMLDLAPDGSILSWNRGAERLLGPSLEQMRGTGWDRLFSAEDQALGQPQRLLQAAQRDAEAAVEGWCLRADGQRRWCVGTLYWQPEAAGFVLVSRDMTEAYQAVQRLAGSEARLQAVLGNASDAIISTDTLGRIELFNPAAERIFGRSAASALGQSVDLLMPATVRDGLRQPVADFLRSDAQQPPIASTRVVGLHADGRRLELEAAVSQAEVGGRMVLTAILRDVTDRARADRALVQYQLELSGLAQHLLAQEKETTRRLAQSLHDELGQTLAALRLSFDALSSGLEPDARPPQLQRVEGLIADANRQVRRVLSDLRPPLLDEQGLAPALDNELRLQGQGFDRVALVLDVAPELDPVRWPDNVEHAAFMIAREAVRNALQHAHAKSIDVSLRGDPARLLVQVHDDGSGLANERRAVRPGHLGLVGMRERALAIGATLKISSKPRAGTTVQMEWLADDDTPVPDR